MKKFLTGIMLVAIPLFISCEKDNEKPGNNNQPQKHWVILKCDKQMTTLDPQIISDSAANANVYGFKIELADIYQYGGFSNSNLNKFVTEFDKRKEYANGLPFEGQGQFYVAHNAHDTIIAKLQARKYEVIRNN